VNSADVAFTTPSSIPRLGRHCTNDSTRSLGDLECIVSKALSVEGKVAGAVSPIDKNELWPGEVELFQKLKSEIRRADWLRGRTALKSLFRRFQEREDTSFILFPNSRFSLSHSGNYAVAAGVDSGLVRGIGVDFQVFRPVSLSMAEKFLSEDEYSWLIRVNELSRSGTALQLWSIKESLFKANVENHGTFLSQYRLMSSHDFENGIAIAPGGRKISYVSISLETGFFSLAVVK